MQTRNRAPTCSEGVLVLGCTALAEREAWPSLNVNWLCISLGKAFTPKQMCLSAAKSGGWAEEWQPAVFVNFLKGSNAVLKILERFLDAGLLR
jgi:hypothetical protein